MELNASVNVTLSLFIVAMLMLLFNRRPASLSRHVAAPGNKAVVSPADGVVKSVQEVTTTPNGKTYTVVSIFIGIQDIHTQVYPVNGLILKAEYFPTRVFNDARKDTVTENEHLDTHLLVGGGDEIIVRQIAGKVARRIEAYHPVGTEVVQGQSLGRITLGSGCELYLPKEFKVLVKEGDRVKVGSTILARKVGQSPNVNNLVLAS